MTSERRPPDCRPGEATAPLLDLTVTISTFNTRALLRGCLQSIYKYTRGISFEVICVDDCSSDGTAAMVAEEFPEVRLIRNPVNQRYAKNQNLGMAMSRGRYDCWLDADTILMGNAFAALVAFMDEHPHAAVCAPKLLNLDGTVQHSIRSFAGPLTFFLQAVNWHKAFPGSRLTNLYYNTDFDYSKPQTVDSIGTTVFMVRRSTWEAAGRLDEKMGQHIVDLAYNYKLRQSGLKVYYTPCAEVIHLGSQSINQGVLTAHREQCQSLIWFSDQYDYFGKSSIIKALVRSAVWARYYSKVLGFYLSSDKRVVKGPGAPSQAQAARAAVMRNAK